MTMDNLDLHHEIERLRSELRDANASIARKVEEMVATESKFEKETERMLSEMSKQKERYERLLSNHQHLSKLNHELEAKLIQTIEETTSRKKEMKEEVESMRARLQEAERQLQLVTAERDGYKEDCAIAVGLLQANPEKFLSQLSQPLSSTTNSRTNSGGHGQPNAAHFPAFLPTFPPVGLSSILPSNPARTAPHTSHSLGPSSSVADDHLSEYPSSSGYLLSKGSAVTHL